MRHLTPFTPFTYDISHAYSEIHADPRYTIAGHGEERFGRVMVALLDAMPHPKNPVLRAYSYDISAEQMAAAVRNDPNWKGREIRLVACNTGRLYDGFAQQLANHLKVNVSAPNSIVGFSSRNGWYLKASISQSEPPKWDYFRPKN